MALLKDVITHYDYNFHCIERNKKQRCKVILAILESHKFYLESDEYYVPFLRSKVVIGIQLFYNLSLAYNC